jgi:hypothetical protein
MALETEFYIYLWTCFISICKWFFSKPNMTSIVSGNAAKVQARKVADGV